jgi:heat shock protein HslJ
MRRRALAIFAVALLSAGADAASANPLTGSWLIVSVAGVGPIGSARARLVVSPDGALSAGIGCNRLFGKSTAKGSAIRIEPLGATRMACPPPAMRREQALSRALGNTARVRAQGRMARLQSASGVDLVMLTRAR